MDLPQLQQWSTDPQLKASALEKATLLKRLVAALFVLIAATFVLMMWVLGSPDSYQENAAAAGPAATWPDGSAKTPHDWWAKANGKPGGQVAQPPATSAAQSNRG